MTALDRSRYSSLTKSVTVAWRVTPQDESSYSFLLKSVTAAWRVTPQDESRYSSLFKTVTVACGNLLVKIHFGARYGCSVTLPGEPPLTIINKKGEKPLHDHLK